MGERAVGTGGSTFSRSVMFISIQWVSGEEGVIAHPLATNFVRNNKAHDNQSQQRILISIP